MKDLRQQLDECLQRRACLLAIGNEEWGDDGFGIVLGKALSFHGLRDGLRSSPDAVAQTSSLLCRRLPVGRASSPEQNGIHPTDRSVREAPQSTAVAPRVQHAPDVAVIFAGTTPENYLEQLRRFAPQAVLLLDAVDIDAEPGAVVFMAASEIRSRFLQISTHKLALGTLASLIEVETGASVWLLGVKAKDLGSGVTLSQPVEEAMSCLRSLLLSIISDRQVCAYGDGMVEPELQLVAQASKPAVSPTSSRQTVRSLDARFMVTMHARTRKEAHPEPQKAPAADIREIPSPSPLPSPSGPSGRGGTVRRQRVETERKDIQACSTRRQFPEKSHHDSEPNGAAIQVGEELA